jgi:hypothetical protein
MMGWTQPRLKHGLITGQDGSLNHPQNNGEGSEMKIKTRGIGLAKEVFGLYGVEINGKVLMHTRISRKRLLNWLAQLEPCLVGIEAAVQPTIGPRIGIRSCRHSGYTGNSRGFG